MVSDEELLAAYASGWPVPNLGNDTENHLAGLRAVAAAAVSETVRDTLPPEGLCGVIYEPPIPPFGKASRADWETCVFLPNHEGKHSWQK